MPSAPTFNSVNSYSRDLDTLKLAFEAPRASGKIKQDNPGKLKVSIAADEYERLIDIEDSCPTLYKDIFRSSWNVKGAPFISPSIGEVGFTVRVIKVSSLGVNESLFNPDNFIDVIKRETEIVAASCTLEVPSENEFDFTDSRVPMYLDAVNCQWVEVSDNPALYSEVVKLRDSVHLCQWRMPIDDDKYLLLSGSIWRKVSNAGNYYRSHLRVPIKPFREVIAQVVQSVAFNFKGDAAEKIAEMAKSLEKNAPILAPSPEYVYLAKSVIKRSSCFGYAPPAGQSDVISSQEASDFIDELIKSRAVAGKVNCNGQVHYVGYHGDIGPVPLSFRKEVPPPA